MKGFSLAEIIVVLAIITLIMGTVLYNAPLFNMRIAMTQAARLLSFGLRDAQSRAVAVQVNASGSAPNTYGIWVTTSTADGNLNNIRDNEQYTLFSDVKNVDGRYDLPIGPTCGDATQDPECVARYTFQRGIRIFRLVRPGPPATNVNEFSILFRRPDPTVSIHDGATIFSPFTSGTFGPFQIYIESSDASINKEIDIWLTGQVSVK